MQAKDVFWWLLPLLLLSFSDARNTTYEETTSDQMPVEARSVDVSGEDDIISSSYVLPNQIFNDGKPYYARQDPVSGQLDFSAKKPAGIEPEANEVLNSKEKIVLSTGSTPNIHDYLNLPVKYTSSKFVYPLVSSSYANLKYQGSNKNFISNKKPSSIVASAPTPTSNYNSGSFFSVPTTKLMAVPTASVVHSSSTKLPSTTTTMTKMTTTKKPNITTIPTVKYTTTTRRLPISTTTASLTGYQNTTRKKFLPTKKNSPTMPTTTASTKNIFTNERLPEEGITSKPKLKVTSDKIALTTRHPTPQASIFPTEPTIPTKILDPADVYHTLGQKNTLSQQQVVSKPPKTISDIFNSLIDEESAVAINYQQNQGFDEQGNLIEPITPSKPSPFVMQSQQQRPIQQQQPNKMDNIQSSTSTLMSVNASLPTIHKSSQHTNEEKIISDSQEHFSNEYVSYQVQQPNVLKYRPMPDQINNVVISPGQQSASFVLGSQQQVGNSMEPSFVKDASGLMYGKVINEDITNIKHPHLSNYPLTQQTKAALINQHITKSKYDANVHQNQNLLSVGPTFMVGSHQESPPEAPVPYQQLPLIGSSSQSPKTPSAVESQSAMQSTQAINKRPDTQELLVSTNIRFPANDEESIKLGPPSERPINGHAHPLSLQQMQNNNHVVFPENKEKDGLNGISNSASNVQIQQSQVLTIQQQSPIYNEPLGQSPSQNMEPPPRYSTIPPRLHGNRYVTPNFPIYNELNRKNQLGPSFRLNLSLPNILPQFRPNAKISNGHSPSFQQEPGNIRLPNIGKNRPYNSAASLQFAHRRQLLQHQQNRYPMNGISDQKFSPLPNNNDINRRVYRLPPYGSHSMQYSPDRLHFHRPNSPQRSVDGYPAERHANLGIAPYNTVSNANLADFEEEDLVINDPPQPVTPNKDIKSNDDTKLEPVITLQMLQSQKQTIGPLNDDSRAGEIQVTSDNDSEPATPSALHSQQADKNGQYLVFATKGDNPKNETANSDRRDSLLSGSEYQNTPFSVTREQPQEPILKNKKPQSFQQQTKTEQLTDKFPYPIEKPDPLYTELHSKTHVPGVLVPSRHSTGGLSTDTEAPIAIAYTPTERTPYKRNITNQDPKFSDVNLATSVINEIRTDSQTEIERLHGDVDLRGQNFENDFMAPFYPSVSLGAANGGNKHINQLNSWNIMSASTDPTIYEKSRIDRADVDLQRGKKESVNTTEYNKENSFELDNFQPDLQGGFKPIYPPGYKHIEEEKGEKTPLEDQKPLAMALTGQLASTAILSSKKLPIESMRNSSSTFTREQTTQSPRLDPTNGPISTSTTIKTPITTAISSDQKKSTFETSLAALLFGNDDSSENKARNTVEEEKNKIAPRNVPRMGPRSLKMS